MLTSAFIVIYKLINKDILYYYYIITIIIIYLIWQKCMKNASNKNNW